MEGNGQARHDATALHWSGRVFSADDLRCRLNGARELVVSPRALITPLAADELRARGVRVIRRQQESKADLQGNEGTGLWGYAQERVDGVVRGVIQAVGRDGLQLRELPPAGASLDEWSRALAECVARGDCLGGIVFCQDPGLVCCVANKVDGLRAVAVVSVAQTVRAARSLAPNLVAVEMPGRTFFELRQIVKTLCGGSPVCPDGVACTIRELENHAHR